MDVTNHQHEIVGEKIKLEEGEIICDECEGRGIDSSYTGYFPVPCQKCQGEKKLDWVSKITGVAPKIVNSYFSGTSFGYSGSSFCGTSGGYQATSGYSSPSHTHTAPISAVQAVASKIDKEIIESYKVVTEQKNKTWRKIFGNRIISKLLFFCNS